MMWCPRGDSIGNAYGPTHITLYIIKDRTHIYAGGTFQAKRSSALTVPETFEVLPTARQITQRIRHLHQQLLTTKVLSWDGPKGIDDAVRANVN